MATVTGSRSRSGTAVLARLVLYDVLSHNRPARWLAVPAPAFLAGWVAADQLDRTQLPWTPGDLIGALLTTPLLAGLLLGLPILVLTVDLPLRQLLDGEATLTFTRVGSRPLWWSAKLVAVASITFGAAVACLAVVWLAGVVRSGSISVLPSAALASLFEFELPSTATARSLLVVGSPVVLTFVMVPVVAIAATVGAATRRLGAAGLAGALLAMSAPFQGLLTLVLPDAVVGLIPGASVLLPLAVSPSGVALVPYLAGSIGWVVAASVVGARSLEDLR